MPNTTKKLISDQVLYKLSGGKPDANNPVDERDIWKSLEQKLNTTFKTQQLSLNLPSGETIPDNLVLALYEDVAITPASNGRSKATLPVMPISLPRNAGINEIRPVISTVSNDKILGQPCIPTVAGQSYLLQADTLLNDLMGQCSYEPNGRTIYFSKNWPQLNVDKCDMKLVVFDMSQYDINDILPIPSDYESVLVNELTMEFAPVMGEQGIVNVWGSQPPPPQNENK